MEKRSFWRLYDSAFAVALILLLVWLVMASDRVRAAERDLSTGRLVRSMPVPVVKRGTCPSDYVQSGGACAPQDREAGRAYFKGDGQCAAGFRQSGAYCQEM